MSVKQVLNIASKIKLNNGVMMPLFGLGCYQVQSEDMEKVIRTSIDNGYILIDTASAYRNEEAIGNVLEKIFKEGKVKREDLFITTKAGTGEHGYDNAITALNDSLKKLKLDYVDLYLIHWPGVKGLKPEDEANSKTRKETWKAFEKLYEEKKCRSIGVSNYTIKHLEELLSHCNIKPTVNQVEFHPFLYQKELYEFCKKNDIVLEAYASLTRGKKFDDEVIGEAAKSLGKTRAQLLLRWAIQKNIVVIPKSSNPERIIENANIFDFEISDATMEKLDCVGDNNQTRICWDPTIVS
ncbi:hypothetical protein DICPUDRAFT_30850 [Dictyostelium purpureum]|uniref:NADP-dependent oxidoreductase domain-containing protein n=1 Tax=Dictyostelium purpureum TaxID=5786 RepID=F0ZG46_DICPU|nr:uncharacterized protein DICPUDRAFT_30850 [Dictyostelium purpureum]EGC37097.1 hypothetical protein DICPUDRAFT_30850 [Dictyostelium purpureum]|eukprot:XP_003286378.1 hypothetical protein DICPUDRAFT_30850 [Dictyostelium purpureum]